MLPPLPGAVIKTFLAPACRCLDAPSSVTNTPVDSMIKSMSQSAQGRFRGLRSETHLMTLPLTVMLSSPAEMSASNRPNMVSYLSRWAFVLGSEVSFSPTSCRLLSLRVAKQRTKLRPIRPKPLIATLTTAPCPRVDVLTNNIQNVPNNIPWPEYFKRSLGSIGYGTLGRRCPGKAGKGLEIGRSLGFLGLRKG